MSQAKPDYYYGAHPKQLDKRVRNNERINKHIVPSTSSHFPVVPNFFIEAKGPRGSGEEALLQACHDGALGARAMHSLQSYGKDQPLYDNNTYAMSSTYHLGTLKIYGHSIAQPNGPGKQPEYYMHQLGGWSMTGNQNTFLQGATAFKNALDWTKDHRDAAITSANVVAAHAVEDSIEEEEHIDHEGNDDSTEEESDEGDEDLDEENEEPGSTNVISSFAGTKRSRVLDVSHEEDDDLEETESSLDELALDHDVPAKRSLSRSRKHYRQKRITRCSPGIHPVRTDKTARRQ